ncbi:MAG: RagB/SusD family nutrient uptake outer membrane protein, partial [Oscillospiraceae bacterium]|nr:RagB/SusD family nutrient uptake outer membrane protein [Oscillospiraceae bacterium]
SVPGIFARVRSVFSANEANVFYFGEVRLGDYMWGPSLKDRVQDNFKISCSHQTLTPSNTIDWGNAYKAIDQANAVLAHSGECNATEAKVKWANAQAYFARAFVYFYAVRLWGEIPMNLLPVEGTAQPETYPSQATAAQVYEQIGKDIEACEACGDETQLCRGFHSVSYDIYNHSASLLEGGAKIQSGYYVSKISEILFQQRLIKSILSFKRGLSRSADSLFRHKRTARNGVHYKEGNCYNNPDS